MSIVPSNPMRLKFAVVVEPLSKERHAIMLHTPVTPADPKKSPRHIRVIGVDRHGQRRQFTVPAQTWQILQSNLTPFVETTIPRGTLLGGDGKPIIPGSKLTGPWSFDLFVVRCPHTKMRIAVAYAGRLPDGLAILGSRDDGKMTRTKITVAEWEQAKLTPVRFVEVEELHAPLLNAKDPLPA